jgi:NAD(P)-dependent dehydrogenase (short-subunit alcohol dehydrogenase family)
MQASDYIHYLARAALPLMKARGWGRIIHISGRDGFAVIPNRAHNVTCKAGVFALSKAIAVEFGEFGITANTVAPGIIDTTRDLTQYPHFRNGYGDRIQEIPVRRAGRIDEIAAACTYLAGAAVSLRDKCCTSMEAMPCSEVHSGSNDGRRSAGMVAIWHGIIG